MPFEWRKAYLLDKLLGLYVGNTDSTDKNLEAKIHKLRNITAAWRHGPGDERTPNMDPLVSCN